jgi:hypothetical protein
LRVDAGAYSITLDGGRAAGDEASATKINGEPLPVADWAPFIDPP